ncbi:MAG: hypothetical protein CMK59_07915 [Proteobacteria bacterium]|nr:hypothetical protein [Pseudomonadota bacterium]
MSFIVKGMILFWGAFGCSFFSEEPTEEQKIQRVLFQVEEAIESEALQKAMSSFSDNYKDSQGLSKKAIQAVLFQRFRKHGPIHLQFSPMVIDVQGDRAEVELEVGILERDGEAILGLPVGTELLHFNVSLLKENQEWKIISHTRELVMEE